jgi:hypothetical protein
MPAQLSDLAMFATLNSLLCRMSEICLTRRKVV